MEYCASLQTEFNKKLFPILEELSKERNLQMLFSASDAGRCRPAISSRTSIAAAMRPPSTEKIAATPV